MEKCNTFDCPSIEGLAGLILPEGPSQLSTGPIPFEDQTKIRHRNIVHFDELSH